MSLSQTGNINQIKNLREFYSPSQKLFDDATELPQFFKTNLIDDSRVVKHFPNDPQANIRIFYYQYLKLCFQIDNVDYESYIEKIYELIRTEGFEFYFEDGDKQKQYKNAQYKSLLIDFFEIMNSSSMTIDIVLTQYPILDEVFTNFFRTVVMIASVALEYNSYIDKNELFDFLSSFFSVDISSYDKCLKFVQSDIFVYEEDPQNIYMAYIRDDQEQVEQSYKVISSSNEISDRTQLNQPSSPENHTDSNNFVEQSEIPQIGINLVEDNSKAKESIAPSSEKLENQLKPRAKTIIKESYIEGQFADYTSFQNISSFGKNISADHEKQVSQTLQHNSTVNNDPSSFEANIQQTSPIKNNQEDNSQHLKRVLSEENHIRFELNVNQGTGYDNDEKSASFMKGNSSPNLLATQSNQKLAESFYEQGESGINAESNGVIENEELSNSKESRMSKNPVSRNQLYQHFQQPTKDPGFGSNLNINVKPVQSTIYHTIQPLKPSSSFDSPPNMMLESNDSISKYVKLSTRPTTQPHPSQPLFHKPIIPIPTLLTQNSLSANSRQVTSSKPDKNQRQSFLKNNDYGRKANLASVRESMKLNVTKQFTNSFVMKSMAEPNKSNVFLIRQRAREFRRNIYREIGYSQQYSSSGGYQGSYQSEYQSKYQPEYQSEYQSPSIVTSNSYQNYQKNQNYPQPLTQQYTPTTMPKHPSSRTNVPSVTTIERPPSSTHIDLDQTYKINNIQSNNPRDKFSNSIVSGIAGEESHRKDESQVDRVNGTTPRRGQFGGVVGQSSSGSVYPVSHHHQQVVVKEFSSVNMNAQQGNTGHQQGSTGHQQNQQYLNQHNLQNQQSKTISLGPSIIVTKHSQPQQNPHYHQPPHQPHQPTQSPLYPYQHPHHLPASMHYTNPLQLTSNQKPPQQSQPQQGRPQQNINNPQQNFIYSNQSVKKPLPVYVPYERRK